MPIKKKIKMKKLFKSVIALLAVGSLFISSCKKGENDPFISFKSRKARVVGEWTVTAGSGTDVNDTGSSSTTTTWTYDGAVETQTTGTVSSTTNVTRTYHFEKDGNFHMVETETGTIATVAYTDETTSEGTWNFTGRVGEEKNKEAILLTITSTTTKYTLGTSTSTSTSSCTGSDCFSMLMHIDQLKNKEMIFKFEGTSTDSSGDVDTSEGTYTLTLD